MGLSMKLRNPIIAACLAALGACADPLPGSPASTSQGTATPGAGIATAGVAPHGEQLLADTPEGWQQTFATKTEALRMAEFIPAGDSRDGWREKLAFESVSGGPLPDPIEFTVAIGAEQASSCDGFEHINIQSGLENNYPTSVRLLTCNRNKVTNQGQVVLIKAIQGNDYFYVITRTKRVPPIEPGAVPVSDEEMASWATYMRTVRVCDPDREAHPC